MGQVLPHNSKVLTWRHHTFKHVLGRRETRANSEHVITMMSEGFLLCLFSGRGRIGGDLVITEEREKSSVKLYKNLQRDTVFCEGPEGLLRFVTVGPRDPRAGKVSLTLR